MTEITIINSLIIVEQFSLITLHHFNNCFKCTFLENIYRLAISFLYRLLYDHIDKLLRPNSFHYYADQLSTVYHVFLSTSQIIFTIPANSLDYLSTEQFRCTWSKDNLINDMVVNFEVILLLLLGAKSFRLLQNGRALKILRFIFTDSCAINTR